MRLKTLLLYISLLLGAYPVLAADFPDDIDYGLTFRSHLFNLDERTGLNLSADGNFSFRRGFTMEFDLRINTEKVYGYIFRIMSGNSSLDMVANVIAGHFSLVLSKGSQVVGNMDINVLSPPVAGWHHVRLDVSGGGGINCNIDNVGKQMEGTLSDLRDIDIRFGWNDHPLFYTTDVPPVSIREIVIKEGKETRFHWQLLRHNKYEVYDLIEGRRAAVKDGNLMVLGGFGNRSGLQEEFPTVLNDIGLIDRNTFGMDSLSTFSWSTEAMIFATSMVYNPSEGGIYALAFRNNRFRSSLNLVSCAPGGVMAVHSSPIPFNFHDTDSYADLIFSSDSSKFYAIVLNTRVNGVNALRVYSLAYPPVPASEIMQPLMRQSHVWIYVLVSVILLLSGGSVSMVVLRHGQKSSEVAAPVEELPGLEEEKPVFYNISLLGGLKIYDRDGNDATSKFTPMLRSLFLFFLLRTFDSGKAVTADELNDVFWFGMEKSMASNNRNVNMRKLRVVLQEIGDISLSFNNDIITMELGDDIRCDYLETKSLLKSVEEADSVDHATLARILRLSQRGTLLSGYEYEWLDRYKSGYAELMICVMMKAAKDSAVSSSPDYMLRIADCILREDCLDEFAVKTKCHFLYKRGQKGLSRQVYDKWCSDYRKKMDSEPEIQYRSMVERHGL